MAPAKPATDKIAAARSFIRSLNILLKFARLYGFDHIHTAKQFDTAWEELRSTISPSDEAGLLLGASGSQLLLDGSPIESTPAERSFSLLLSAAGLASIQFLPRLKRADLESFIRAFPTGNTKASQLAAQLKTALKGSGGIRINEIRFVAEDASTSEIRTAASLMAKTLGGDADQVKAWLNEPQKLLQLIAAAEGSRGEGGIGRSSGPPGGSPQGVHSGGTGTSGAGTGSANMSGTGTSGTLGAGSGSGASFQVGDEEMMNMFRLVSRLGQTAAKTDGPGPIKQEIEKMPGSARNILQQALATLAAQTPSTESDQPMLLRLAEHLAIRFALERFDKGEVRVNAVREMIDRMSQEISALRNVLGLHEERLAQAGIVVESQADLLDRQFWAAVPEAGKRAVLTSEDAWCVPPRNIRQYLMELEAKSDLVTATAILENYSVGINHEDAQVRRKTATGIAELADLYAGGDAPAIEPAIRATGMQLSLERDVQLQGLVSAAFVRLGQEAASHRRFGAVRQSLDSLDAIENHRPTFAQSVRPRLGLEQRLPDLIAEAARTIPKCPANLLEVIGCMPLAAAQDLVKRFNRSIQRPERERVVQVAEALGPPLTAHLRDILQQTQVHEAVEAIGLLMRLDPAAIESVLKIRLTDWPQIVQDRALRHIAGSGAPERGALLLSLFDQFDPLLQPLALDEIGMSGEKSAAAVLLSLAIGGVPKFGAYARLKAIEALGRLRVTEAAEGLRAIVEAKKLWQWQNPSELRLAAFLALRHLAPDWAAGFYPASGFTEGDIQLGPRDSSPDQAWFRQRRHLRVRLKNVLPASATFGRETISLQVRALSLSGGLASGEKHVAPGTIVTLRLGGGMRPIRAQAFMRGARAQALSFEFADMDLEDRARLRRLLQENVAPNTGLSDAPSTDAPVDRTASS